VWNKDKKIILINNLEKLAQAQSIIDKAELIAIDTETNGLGRFCDVIGIGIAVSEDEAYYIPIQIYSPEEGLINPWSTEAYNIVKSFIIGQLTKSKRLLGHNSSFDAKSISNTFGIEIIENFWADTCLLHHTVINESPPHGLKDLAIKYLDYSCSNPQEDLRQSVIDSGGRWLKDDKELYKGNWELIGTYCAMDVLMTFGLYNRFYPEIEKQGLQKLWFEEVMALLPVTYQLNTTGLRIDIPYFEKLKVEMEQRIEGIEDEIYSLIEESVKGYELTRLKESITITKKSGFGRWVLSEGYTLDPPNYPLTKLWDFYKAKNKVKRVFNLDSNDDKAFLLFDVLGLPCKTETAKGKRAVTAAIIKELSEKYEDKSVVLKLLSDRAKEKKLLSTYVIPFLEQNIDGRIYPSFNQVGTTSGRYSSNSPNFQNIPSRDNRIKKGIIPDEGYVLIDSDQESLEPKCFSHISSEDSIKKVYTEGLDFYSQVYLTVMKDNKYSSNPKDPNFLKLVAPKLRDKVKTWALGLAYGMTEYKLSEELKIPLEEAVILKNRYFKAYPNLLKYHSSCTFQLKKYGFVNNLLGRRRRAAVIPFLYKKGFNPFNHKDLIKSLRLLEAEFNIHSIKEAKAIINNEQRNGYNFPIQSLAASIMNKACIDFYNEIKNRGLDAYICCQVHDQITVLCKTEQSEEVSKILQKCMENNSVTKEVSVPMKAIPVIVNRWSDAK